MSRGFRDLKEKLEIYFFNSTTDLLKSAEQYLDEHPEEKESIYEKSITDDTIMENPEYPDYNANSELTIDEQFAYDEIKKFSNMPLLREAIEKFDIIKRGLDLGGDFDQSRMKFTSLPRGVFNFGLASKGLIRKVEYYDETNRVVVEDKFVRESTFDGQTKVFFYMRDGKKQLLRRQQKNTTIVQESFPNVSIEYNEAQKIYLPYRDGNIYNGEGDKMLGYVTTTKKVYMYREKLGGGVSPYVDLFVNVSGSWQLNTENYLAKNLPAFIVADILEKAGVRVRIYGLFAVKTIYDAKKDNIMLFTFAIKEYGETLDFNKLASFTCDIRFIRVSFYRAVATMRRKEDKVYRSAHGIPQYGTKDDDLFNSFTMFKNWLFDNKGTLKYDTKINDKNLMVLSGFSNVTPNFKLKGEGSEATYKAIEKEVYRTLDYVGMLLTKNPNKFIGKVYEREREINGKSLNAQTVRNYLEKLITDNLVIVPQFDTVNKDSPQNRYSTPLSEVPRIRERTDGLIEVIRQVVN